MPATACRSLKPLIAASEGDLGLMVTPAGGRRTGLVSEFRYWGADTGCFAKPDSFDQERYLEFLSGLIAHRARCLFATAPDRYGDGRATLEVALPVLPKIRQLGIPAALVAQPGSESLIPWGEFDALFVGGPDPWQTSDVVAGLVSQARERGIWTHRGRVNSFQRLCGTALLGYDSADGTHVAYGPDKRLPQVLSWLGQLNHQALMQF